MSKLVVKPKAILYTIAELCAGIIFSSFAWSFILFVYILNQSLRRFVNIALNYFYGDKYTVANGEDSIFGTRIKNNCGSLIAGYEVFEGEGNIETIRDRFHKLLTDTNDKYDRLTQSFVSKFGYFCWEKKSQVDLNKHIRVLDGWDHDVEKMVIYEEELHQIMERFSSTPMSSDVPQWEILMVPNYQMKNPPVDHDEHQQTYALIFRFHHSYCDGVSFLLMTNNYLADKPGQLPIDPSKPVPAPAWAKALIWTKVVILGPMYFVMNMASFIFLDMTEYKVPYYSERKLYARSPLLKMDSLKQLRKNSGATITAILMSCTYAAMYRAHLKVFKGRKVPDYFINGNVTAMLPYTDDKLCNRFTLFPLTGPFKEQDPKEKLEKMIEINKKSHLSPDPTFDFYVQRGLGSLPAFMHRILFGLSGSPLMLSNVPGYNTHLEIFGSKMVDVAAWLPLVSTTGIGIATQSYCGSMRLCGIVDSNVFSRKADLQELLDDIVREIHILAEIYHVPDVPVANTLASTSSTDVNNNHPDVLCRNNHNNYEKQSEPIRVANGRNSENENENNAASVHNDSADEEASNDLRSSQENADKIIDKDINSINEDIRRRLIGKSIQ